MQTGLLVVDRRKCINSATIITITIIVNRSRCGINSIIVLALIAIAGIIERLIDIFRAVLMESSYRPDDRVLPSAAVTKQQRLMLAELKAKHCTKAKYRWPHLFVEDTRTAPAKQKNPWRA